MIKLSRTGWNNLIIFAMLLMIFLFNGLHLKLNPSVEDMARQPLLQINSLVLTIEFDLIKVERIGTGWRSNSQHQVDLEQLVTHWQTSELDITEIENTEKMSQLAQARVWLAGQNQATLFQLYKLQEAYLIFDQNKQVWFKLETQHVSKLFPYYTAP